MENTSKVAIFIDAENLTHWIKCGGVMMLLEQFSSAGFVAVRKAYGRWSIPNLAPHQAALNEAGFELIHTFHPISGKNSADMQLAVDVMEYVSRVADIDTIVLATGDADFGPLFRKLREMGKNVIGAGPKSALSEIVKTSCSRFIYTDDEETESAANKQNAAGDVEGAAGTNTKTRSPDFEDAAELLRQTLSAAQKPLCCSKLKSEILHTRPSFNERKLGFRSFIAFVKTVDDVSIESNGKALYAYLRDKLPYDIPVSTESEPEQREASLERYDRILRKKQMPPVELEVVVKTCKKMLEIQELPKREMADTLFHLLNEEIDRTAITRAVKRLFGAKLVYLHREDAKDRYYRIMNLPLDRILYIIDRAMLSRLITGTAENLIEFEIEIAKTFLLCER